VSIDVRQVGRCSVVGIEDRFDAGYAHWLGHSLSAFAEDEPGASIVIDLSEVAPIEPDAVTALWEGLEPSGVPVAIVNQRLTARRIVRRLGGTRLLVFPTVAMAVDALGGAGDGRPHGG
jgi:anti-anti-sigma regulatory factor